jgi:hypothetical protein
MGDVARSISVTCAVGNVVASDGRIALDGSVKHEDGARREECEESVSGRL